MDIIKIDRNLISSIPLDPLRGLKWICDTYKKHVTRDTESSPYQSEEEALFCYQLYKLMMDYKQRHESKIGRIDDGNYSVTHDGEMNHVFISRAFNNVQLFVGAITREKHNKEKRLSAYQSVDKNIEHLLSA